jgi:SAM-dependent methyltransferase
MEFLSADYWSERYLQHKTGWDIGYISTPIKEYFDQLTDKNISILIPGCGNSYEAKYLLKKGFTNITVVDISPVLTDALKNSLAADSSIHILTKDFFTMDGAFDLIIEQTFFCALDPSLREEYVKKMYTLLTGNGKLVGLLFNKEFPASPPFGGNEKEYRQLFSSVFRIKVLEACNNSIPERMDTELFLIAEKMDK